MQESIIKKIFRSYLETVGKTKLIFILIFGMITTLIGVAEPIVFTQIIKYLEEFYKTGLFDINSFFRLIIFRIFFIILSISISFIYLYYFISVPLIRHYTAITEKFSSKVINMTYSKYLESKAGSIYKILDRGIEAEFWFLYIFFVDFYRSFISISSISIILFYLNFKMALLTLSMVPFMIFFGSYFYKKFHPTQRQLNMEWESVFGDIGNIMSNFLLTKSLILEKFFQKTINLKLYNILGKQLKVTKGWAISDLYTNIFVMISRIIVLSFGVYFVIQNKISFTELFLYFSYIGYIYFPLGYIFTQLKRIQELITSIERLYNKFDNIGKDLDDKGQKIKEITGNIEFKNVSFEYIEGKNVINKMSFEIKAGESIAFVGNTGAGKSTIVSLILRLWDTKSGEILINGIDIKEINKASLRNHIGLVSQDNSLFNLSIKENLLFANPKATSKELEEAIKEAEAHFVFDFKDGIDTIIGERGLKLSGGEKQRLSIARLFLKNPTILILDEATSALDNKTEKLVQKALEKLMKGKTSIIIAHRLSTVQNADKIFMLKNGKIVESGNYEELMYKKGEFYDLANPEHLIIN